MTAEYSTSLEHLLAELRRLDLLLRIQAWRTRQRHRHDEQMLAAFPAANDASADACSFLDAAVGTPTWASVSLSSALREALQARLDQMAAEIAERMRESLCQGRDLRLVELADLFDLTPFDVDAVLVCLAPEIDRRYERLFAHLHDDVLDVTARQPTVDLVLNLLCPDLQSRLAARTRFTAAAPLLRHGLLQVTEDDSLPSPSLLGTALQLERRVVRFLLDDDGIDDRLEHLAQLVTPATGVEALLFPPALQRRLTALVEDVRTDGDDLVVYLQGPYGVGKQSVAEACCRTLDADMLMVHGSGLADTTVDELATLARAIDREARLQRAVLYWEDFDALLAEGRHAHLKIVLTMIEAHPGPTFLAGTTAWEPRDALRAVSFTRLELPQPGHTERVALWRAALADHDTELPDPDLDLAALANKFRLSGGQIADAVATARSLARAHTSAPGAARITRDELHTACRLQSNRRLAELAQEVIPRYCWDDIVLPADQLEQLREIHDQVRYRSVVHGAWGFEHKLALGKGLNVLFAGPAGTGKTMAAEVLANTLGLYLYKIDLAGVVSKYIGETEKNLARIFDEAATSNAILFFDEADALFGRRTQVRDAHDRYANIETSYLLQKMEEYEGVVILATNLRKNMDDAFVRRLQFTVEFPMPDVEDRRRIWTRIWPETTPRDPGLDLERLAREVDVTGGAIRNIALASAFLAAADGGVVTSDHVVHATQREYRKMGRVLTTHDLGRNGGTSSEVR